MIECRMCNSDTLSEVFGGPIRDGGVGASTVGGYKIIKCEQCNLVQISPVPKQIDSFYESHEYRVNWDVDYDPIDIHKKYDHEQNERISRIGVQNIRNATIIDLGCSAGVFLDAVQSLAGKTIAVEPFEYYSRYLKERGHTYYPYPQDAINQGELADIVTSFDVIEHIEHPKDFINSAFKLLKSEGEFVLSMPNLNDILLSSCTESFSSFFYQTAHLNYFSHESIQELFNDTGFIDIKIDYLHKYNCDNLMRWLKYDSPGEMPEVKELFDRTFDSHFKAEIERLGLSSHLFITAKKPI